MKKIYLILIVAIVFAPTLMAQTDSTEKVAKSGWSFGAVPAIAYDSDIGFKYGGVVNFYHYGDGSRYPEYNHSLYLEWSQTTKGSGIMKMKYDSKYLIPNVRTTIGVSYLTEQALDFFGFNGYEAEYNPNYADDTHTDYISRMYYKHERKQFIFSSDFVGRLFHDNLFWVGGFVIGNNKIGTVDIDKLNDGKDEADKLPDTDLLYDKYIGWGIIPDNQKTGGNTNLLKFGLVYDTRDNEPNPMKGIWSEALLITAPSFINSDYSYTQLCLTHRQYFTIQKDILNFAYRLGYQKKISGEVPFYMLPLVHYSNKPIRDALGGARTLRGILRNRIVGDDFAYGNFEFRWKFFRKVIFKQNFYSALSCFADVGMVTKNYEFDSSNVPSDYNLIADKETLHSSFGAGLHLALNENFIVSVSYGLAADERDGKSGLYINLDFLF